MSKPAVDPKYASILDYLKSWPLYFLPHHMVSRVIFKLTRLTIGQERAIRWFISKFKVDMSEAAQEDIQQYPTFNAFFTRELKPGARKVTQRADQIASPADGAISALGAIEAGRIFQAKGHDYSLYELLGGDQNNTMLFMNGRFATIYLSPRDYHRVHMPLDGRLRSQTYIPGRLFSVAPHTARTIPRLFSRNERLVCHFDTSLGAMAMLMVGAINVAAIETVWAGLVTPPAGKQILHVDYSGQQSISLQRGAEMGRFNMGSTVILLFEKSITWQEQLVAGSVLRMGQAIATTPADYDGIITA